MEIGSVSYEFPPDMPRLLLHEEKIFSRNDTAADRLPAISWDVRLCYLLFLFNFYYQQGWWMGLGINQAVGLSIPRHSCSNLTFRHSNLSTFDRIPK
jgi:hypothetical protein